MHSCSYICIVVLDNSYEETLLLEKKEIGSLHEVLSHEDFKFGDADKLTFKVYVFDIEGTIKIKVTILSKI